MVPHRRMSGSSPLYRFSAMQLMSACAGEPKFCTIFLLTADGLEHIGAGRGG